MKFEGMTFGGETFNEIIFQTKNAFLQFAFAFNAVNYQNSQCILQHSLCCHSVNMTKNLRVNLVSNYGGWGTADESSTNFHRIAMLQTHCNVTDMSIDTYGDQNNIKYPNKIKLTKLAVE